jgi:hypothetical protein
MISAEGTDGVDDLIDFLQRLLVHVGGNSIFKQIKDPKSKLNNRTATSLFIVKGKAILVD